MSEIKCPNCGKTFKVDDSSYADILSQVRNHEFEAEVQTRLAAAEKQAAIEKKQQATELKSALKISLAEKDTELERLKAQLAQANTERELAVAKAIAPLPVNVNVK